MTVETKAKTPQTKALITQEKAIVKWKGEAITISFSDVKDLICPLATDQEVVIFLKTCRSLQLNPFASEIFLIKYSERDKAAMVISIESYLKAGETNDNFDGYESGIILKDTTGKLDYRDSAFLLDEERGKLVGGWARVYRKDRTRPSYIAVSKKECLKYRRDGSLTEFWIEEKQPWMLRKVALKRALVEAFPSLFTGSISNVDYETLPTEVKEVLPQPKGETQEGELPPTLEKGGHPDWKKFWARVKSELELTPKQARELLHVDSIKEELINTGWTMEKIWEALVAALQKQTATETEPEQIVDVQTTDERITQGEDLFGEGEAGAAALVVVAETKQPTGAAAPAKPKRDPETIKTINELLKACNVDFGIQPKDVYAELNVNSASGIVESPADCYRKITSVRS